MPVGTGLFISAFISSIQCDIEYVTKLACSRCSRSLVFQAAIPKLPNVRQAYCLP